VLERHEIDRIFGADVYDSDGGKIGSASQVYVDDETGEPAWVTVRTGLFGTRESFIPLAEAYFTERGLTVPFDKDFIKGAPNHDVDGHLTPAAERDLYAYYGTGDTADEGRRSDTDPESERDDHGPATVRVGHRDDADRRSDVGVVGDRSADTDDRDLSGSATDDTTMAPKGTTDVGTEHQDAGRLRLRKVVVTENVMVTVPVQREEVRIEPESSDGGGLREERDDVADSGMTGSDRGPARGNEGDDR
jgi:sporulation protein YlmC with PRC-barrel domain